MKKTKAQYDAQYEQIKANCIQNEMEYCFDDTEESSEMQAMLLRYLGYKASRKNNNNFQNS